MMEVSKSMEKQKIVKRLNTTLPDPLARFVGEITGEGGLYETPGEFIRDLIRRYMENVRRLEYKEINVLLTNFFIHSIFSHLSNEQTILLDAI